jgi:hypothetical protein
MKKILVLFTLSILLWGCSKKAENKVEDLSSKLTVDTTEMKTVPVDNPNVNFSMHFNFQKGKTYLYRLASFSDDIKTFKFDSVFVQSVKQSTVYLVNITLDNVDKDGVMEFTCNIPSILCNEIANGQVINYQSGKTKDSTALQAKAEYEALIDNPFSLRIGKEGGILEIFRADKIVNKFFQLKPFIPSEKKEEVRTELIQEELRPLVTQIFRDMPSKTMMKDSSWAIQQPETKFLIFNLQSTNLFKVLGLEKYGSDTLASINAGMKSVVTGDPKYINKERGTEADFKVPQPSASGTIYFNISKGYIQKSSVKTQVNISYSIKGPKPTGGIQKGTINEAINSSNILELL